MALANGALVEMQVYCASIDHLATPVIVATAKRESIYLEQRFSDHAPVVVDFKL